MSDLYYMDAHLLATGDLLVDPHTIRQQERPCPACFEIHSPEFACQSGFRQKLELPMKEIMTTERLALANKNRQSLVSTLRTATGMEATSNLFTLTSVDIRNQPDRTALYSSYHTERFREKMNLAYASFRQQMVALAMEEAQLLEEEFKNL